MGTSRQQQRLSPEVREAEREAGQRPGPTWSETERLQAPATPPLASLRPLVAPYERPDDRVALQVLATSLLPYPVAWWLAYEAMAVSYWLTLLLTIVAAAFAVRTFIVQHDCGHNSFWTSRRLCALTGRLCALVTLTPFAFFRRLHAAHHATSGKLDERGVDIETLTVREYRALSAAGRLRYRVARHPLVLFVLAPSLVFLIALRLPVIARDGWVRERRSILLTDLALATVYGALAYTVGLRAFVLVQLPITAIASGVGVWLFYVQHQFEDAYWARDGEWDYARAALEGSSYLALPPLLEWCTGFIGLHHVHHLSPRIPSYRMRACHHNNAALAHVPRLGLRAALRTSRLKLWDEESRKLVGWPRG